VFAIDGGYASRSGDFAGISQAFFQVRLLLLAGTRTSSIKHHPPPRFFFDLYKRTNSHDISHTLFHAEFSLCFPFFLPVYSPDFFTMGIDDT
jgi:hypothetical protein